MGKSKIKQSAQYAYKDKKLKGSPVQAQCLYN